MQGLQALLGMRVCGQTVIWYTKLTVRSLAGWNGNVQGTPKYHSPFATLGGFAASGHHPVPTI